MQYYTRPNNKNQLEVLLDGPEEDQRCQSILAENIYNARTLDSIRGKIICFDSNKQFKNFLFWREIFNQHSPQNTFSFFKYARSAAKIARDILNNRVIELDSAFS